MKFGSRMVIGWMAVLLCAWLGAQTRPATASSKRPTDAKGLSARGTAKKVPLSELTLVSTSAAAQAAVASKAVKHKSKQQSAPAPSVSEFHPVEGTSSAQSTYVLKKEKKDRGLFHNIHGSVYGENGAGVAATGGAVGATSKSGKLSVYVGTEHAATTTPSPH